MTLRALAMAGVVIASVPAVAHADLARLAVSGDNGIYTIRADGSDRHQLTDHRAGNPAWSADGSRIAFVRTLPHDRAQIWTMRADGSDQRALTPSPGKESSEITPAWSPDGRSIAFARWRTHRDSVDVALVVIGADGRHPHKLATLRPQRLGWLSNPAWSPDGRRLLYTRAVLSLRGSFSTSLWIVKADAGGRHLLAKETGYGSWSPDGARIAAVSTRDRNGQNCGEDECDWDGEIYVMNADGTAPTRLTASKADDEGPAWSPDGGHIAFASTRNYPDERVVNDEIYSIKPDGTCLTWLTNGSSSSALPAWQPGAGLSSDPGTCGPTPRSPLVDTPVPKPPLGHGAQTWWLGRVSPEGLLLTDASEGYYDYGDCGSFDPAGCPESVDIGNRWVCSKDAQVLSEFNARSLKLARGALLYKFLEPDADVQMYTGTTIVSVSPARLETVLDQLRPANSEQPFQGNFPPPRLPDSVWRQIDPVEAAFNRLHSVKRVARKLHHGAYYVRSRLAVGKRLRELGVTGRVHCAP
ncbi:MAG: hypothetical protein ACJ77M_12095 [Thermoleophilaceae bacterium]